MNKSELADQIALKVGVSKRDADAMLDAFATIVTEQLQKGNEVTLTGFGTFLSRFRSARKGVNPQNPSQTINIEAVTVAKFKTGKALKDALKHAHNKQTAPAPQVPQTPPAPQTPPTTPTM